MKRYAILFSIMLVLLLTGCTHMMKFNVPPVASKASAVSSKGTATIGAVEDKRPAESQLFVFATDADKWIFEGDKKPEEIMRSLIKEGLKRRGIETSDTGAPMTVTAQIVDFSGRNEIGVFYNGVCNYRIACAIRIVGPAGEKSFVVNGLGKDHVGRVSGDNVAFLMNLTYEDFLKNFNTELANAGF